ncbi:MAG: ChrR family anti-sigma-E factor [Pseudomonadales bacterium]|nr:ChrR family anti-sigma-E factor [Pseudomonadales bacterium]
MNVNKHPDPAWWVSYSAGTLSAPFTAVLQAHLAVCPACRKQLQMADNVGAALMAASAHAEELATADDLPPSEIGHQTDEPVEWARNNVLDTSEFTDRYIGMHLDGLDWIRAGRGLRVCRLGDAGSHSMWVIRAEPNTVLPEHSHNGSELTLVVKGSYFCEDRIYGVGEIEDADEGTLHQPVVTSGEECICIAAVEGPLRFKQWVPRLTQRFVGI